MTSRVLPYSLRTAQKAFQTRDNPSLKKSKNKITLTIWIACIKSYMEYAGMDTAFNSYDTYLKTEVYLLYEWGAAEDRK